MAGQQIIWTGLPNGRRPDNASEKLMLSVAASPRLRLEDGGVGTLQSFPDFLDWPARVKQSSSGIDLFVDDDNTHPIRAAIVRGVASDPDLSDLWKALVAETQVRSAQFEGLQSPVAHYSMSGVGAELAGRLRRSGA